MYVCEKHDPVWDLYLWIAMTLISDLSGRLAAKAPRLGPRKNVSFKKYLDTMQHSVSIRQRIGL